MGYTCVDKGNCRGGFPGSDSYGMCRSSALSLFPAYKEPLLLPLVLCRLTKATSSSPGVSKDVRIIRKMGVFHVEIEQILLSSEFEVHLSCLSVHCFLPCPV